MFGQPLPSHGSIAPLPTNTAAITDLTACWTRWQIWLAMYHLMCEEECRKRYHFNSMRKENILRARKYLNDVLLDQLPVLAGVQR